MLVGHSTGKYGDLETDNEVNELADRLTTLLKFHRLVEVDVSEIS